MGLSVVSILQSLIFVLIGLYIGITISGINYESDITSLSLNASLNAFESANKIRGSVNAKGDANLIELREQLTKSQDEIKRLQSLTETLKSKHASIPTPTELDDPCDTKGVKKDDVNPATANIHPICRSIMPHTVPTAMDLWNQNILKILSASRIPQDIKFKYHDFTTQLLQIISPRLPRSVKTTPFDWRPVENALTVAWKRYQYLQLPKKERDSIPIHEKPRPLKVLIMGGSLLVGTNCRILNTELNFQFRMPKRDCNWSSRLGHFLNRFFLGDPGGEKDVDEKLIELEKVAMGGTNTATGSVIWQYDLIPENARNPDVVINAYSTNDMHILTVIEAQSSNTTLRDKTFEMIQKFVRQVLGTKQCSSSGDELIPPLLLHMDDYLGNEQRKIWETTELSQGAQVLANYYGFVSVSYADVIREFVYGDTYESWFSSEWWVKDKKKPLAFERQIHPGMGMHISSIWVTAYNLLHLASSYCSMPTDVIHHLSNNNITEYKAGLLGLPDLELYVKQAKGKPKPQPKGLPPELTKDLLLEDVTSLWKNSDVNDGGNGNENQSNSATSSCKLDQSSSTARVKCPFSWVSGLSLQQNDEDWVNEYFKKQSSTWEGWKLSKDGGKLGFIPSSGAATENARMVLEFSYSQKIQSITLFFMKSYGTKWKNSELEVRILSSSSTDQQDGMLLEKRNLLGTHAKNTSEMYTEEIVLGKPVDAGEKILLEAKLVGGTTFKLMGLAVCS